MDEDDFLVPGDVDALLREAEAFEEDEVFPVPPDSPYASSSSPPRRPRGRAGTDSSGAAAFSSPVAARKRAAGGASSRGRGGSARGFADAGTEVVDCDAPSGPSAPFGTPPPSKRFKNREGHAARANGTSSSSSSSSSAGGVSRAAREGGDDVDALLTSSYGPLAFGFDDWGPVPSMARASVSWPQGPSTSTEFRSHSTEDFFSTVHDLRERVYRASLDANSTLPPLAFGSLVPLSHRPAGRDREETGDEGEGAHPQSAVEKASAVAATLDGQHRSVRVFPVDVRGGGIPFFLKVLSPEEEQRRQRKAARACGSAAVYDEEDDEATEARCTPGRTLRRSMQDILREAMEEEAAEAAKKAAEAAEEAEQPSPRAHKDSRRSASRAAGQEGVRQWTEKYRAKRVVELLSPPATNRSMLVWLRRWQQRLERRGSKKERKSEDAKTEASRKLLKGKTKGDGNAEKTDAGESDEFLPRILLLGGAPGIGKTTLAHVCARHFGFDVVEVNGSDDRSRATLLPLVMNCVTGADSFFHASKKRGAVTASTGASRAREESQIEERAKREKSKRPILLVIDEIDGAAAGGGGEEGNDSVVEIIARLVKKKDAKGKPFIKRPVICICNDLYARVLRPLREVAHIMNLAPPPRSVLVERLAEILRENKLTADRQFLDRLIDVFEGDIRACINALDFMSRKSLSAGSRELREEDLELCAVGKDREKHVQDFVRFVFTPPSRSQPAPAAVGLWAPTPSKNSVSFLEAFGALAPAVDAYLAPALLQENFTQLVRNDWNFDKLCYGTELLAFSDCCACPALLGSRFSFGSADKQSGTTSSTVSPAALSLLPFSLFASHFCVTSSNQAFFYAASSGGTSSRASLVSPSLSVYRVFRKKQQSCQAAVAALSAFASRARQVSPSEAGEGEGGLKEPAGAPAPLAACGDLLRVSFARDTVSALVRLALPTYRHNTDFAKLPPFNAAPEVQTGARRPSAGGSMRGESSRSKADGQERGAWKPAGESDTEKRQRVESALADAEAHGLPKSLAQLALGPLLPASSSLASLPSTNGKAAPARGGSGRRSDGERPELPRSVQILAKMAALLTAYGLSFIEVRHDAEPGSAQSARLRSSFRLEPPLDLLLSLEDCRRQQGTFLQARQGRRAPSGLGAFSGASSASLVACGGASRGSSSLFLSAAQSDAGSDLCSLFLVPIVHPFSGLSERSCSFLMEAKRYLNAHESPFAAGPVKKDAQKPPAGKKGEKGGEKVLDGRKKAAGSHALPPLEKRRLGGQKTDLAAAIILVREVGWVAFMVGTAGSEKRRKNASSASSSHLPRAAPTSDRRYSESAEGAFTHAAEGREGEDAVAGADGRAKVSAALAFSQCGGLNKGGRKSGGSETTGEKQLQRGGHEAGLRLQHMSLKDFLAEQTKVAQAIRKFGCVVHQLPASQKTGKTERGGQLGGCGARSVVACLFQRQREAEKRSDMGADAAATDAKTSRKDSEGGEGQKTSKETNGETTTAGEPEDGFTVIRNMTDMYRSCTNGYFKFLEGRCNAVVQPVADDLFL
ncbi:ATPase, AAA family protein [Besnoitia besnoiti]|uniref:ATPase, AAA family protein n=1 Tax=Besnoitia besnoiti TaxID=94643 RepID=A0A2A9MB75_BESBE|nr:ATPase, AAA family protein [Besnoitia besnoiti]PFH35738.1 ATPase, AAA family protein [Besnoitia besnoiti]